MDRRPFMLAIFFMLIAAIAFATLPAEETDSSSNVEQRDDAEPKKNKKRKQDEQSKEKGSGMNSSNLK